MYLALITIFNLVSLLIAVAIGIKLYGMNNDIQSDMFIYLQALFTFHFTTRMNTFTLRYLISFQVPLVFTLMALIVIKTIPSAKDSPSLTLNMSHFDRNQVLYSIKTGTPQQSHKLSHLYKAQVNTK